MLPNSCFSLTCGYPSLFYRSASASPGTLLEMKFWHPTQKLWILTSPPSDSDACSSLRPITLQNAIKCFFKNTGCCCCFDLVFQSRLGASLQLSVALYIIEGSCLNRIWVPGAGTYHFMVKKVPESRGQFLGYSFSCWGEIEWVSSCHTSTSPSEVAFHEGFHMVPQSSAWAPDLIYLCLEISSSLSCSFLWLSVEFFLKEFETIIKKKIQQLKWNNFPSEECGLPYFYHPQNHSLHYWISLLQLVLLSFSLIHACTQSYTFPPPWDGEQTNQLFFWKLDLA